MRTVINGNAISRHLGGAPAPKNVRQLPVAAVNFFGLSALARLYRRVFPELCSNCNEPAERAGLCLSCWHGLDENS